MPDQLARLQEALGGRYTLQRELGQGGMATVYLAEDLKHRRPVAIKVLKPELAAVLGPERFLREIEVASKLTHPHILPVYDSGRAEGPMGRKPGEPTESSANGQRLSADEPSAIGHRLSADVLYYVMPYVEGESLRDRLTREKQLPLDDALQISREVADALSYAHSRGVIHRDVKPENILLESGHAVVADFGIARAVDAAGGNRLTETGLAIGTPAYMSPEQAAGEADLDARSDLYALGCMLYEMLAGQPPFTGPTAESVVRQHLTAEPAAVTQLRPRVPAPVSAAIERALAKSRADRFSTVAAFAQALAVRPQAVERAAPRRRIPRAAWIGGALATAAVAILWLGARYRLAGGAAAAPAVTLRQVTSSPEVEEYPALSPDGERLIFSRDVGGSRQLVLTNLADGREEVLTAGEFDNIQPAWSPDGQAVLFVRSGRPRTRLEPADVFGMFTGGDIWRRDLATGAEELLITDAYNPDIAADGRIAFDASHAGTRRIWVADQRGRNARQVTVDSSEAVTHVDPSWSPDGARLVFQHIERTKFDIAVADVGRGSIVRLTDDGFLDVNPRWTADGKVVDFSSYRSGGLNVWRLPVTKAGAPGGPAIQLTTGAGQDVQLAASRMGGRLAFTVLRINADLWRMPVDPGTGRPTAAPEPVVVTTREDSRGAWSPDGRAIAFNSDRSGDMNIWIHTLADGTDRQLTHGAGGDYQPAWSPDGSTLAFFSARAGNADIWLADTASGRLTRLTTSPWLDINPFFSPDGGRIAFQSDRQGRMEVWVMDADGTNQHAVTDIGVAQSHFVPWTPDGRMLYFRAAGPGSPVPMRVRLADSLLEATTVQGGAHMSFNPTGTLIADVVGHQRIWVSPTAGGAPYVVFAFDDPEVRIDYPRWSPDGRWILFDRWEPQGGDIWLLEVR